LVGWFESLPLPPETHPRRRRRRRRRTAGLQTLQIEILKPCILLHNRASNF